MLVEPYVGVDKITFGMTRSQVRGIFSTQPTPQDTEGVQTDFWLDQNFAVHYEENRCVAIEAFSPESLEVVGKNIVGLAHSQLKSWLVEHDTHAELTETDLLSNKFGIAGYLPDGRVETALAFQRGYFGKEVIVDDGLSTVPATAES